MYASQVVPLTLFENSKRRRAFFFSNESDFHRFISAAMTACWEVLRASQRMRDIGEVEPSLWAARLFCEVGSRHCASLTWDVTWVTLGIPTWENCM